MAKVNVLGVQIDDIDMAGALARIESALVEGRLFRVVTPNPEILLKASSSRSYQDVLNMAELAIPDGSGLVLFSRLSGVLTGVDLCEKVVEMACRKGYRLFLLGAAADVVGKVAEVWQKRYPGILLVGAYGECTPEAGDVFRIADMVNASGADIVMVAFGAPYQERWMFAYRHLMGGVRVWMGIGGTFDFVSGRVKRAPKFVQVLYLEWLWRLVQQPTRVARIFRAVVVFPLVVLFFRKR